MRAARETRYYADLFARSGVNPARLRYADIARLPLTPKEALRNDPDAFVRQGAQPVFRSATTGTTGHPTSISFSAYELQTYIALTAMSLLQTGMVLPEDIVLICGSPTSARPASPGRVPASAPRSRSWASSHRSKPWRCCASGDTSRVSASRSAW